MVLVILLTNIPIRKRKEMKKIIQIEKKCTKERKQKINSSRNDFSQKKTTLHQTKMKTVKVRHNGSIHGIIKLL
jgi:hypothetical protein